MSDELHKRFQELVAAIEEECWRHSQNPGGGILQVDDSLLKVTLPLDSGVWFPRRFHEQEVLGGNLRQIASEFYASYKSAIREEC